jgi:hypothetical protein
MQQNLQQKCCGSSSYFHLIIFQIASIARMTTVQELHEEIEDIYKKNNCAEIN